MRKNDRPLTPDEAAEETGIDKSLIGRYAELGLITPTPEGYTGAELAELRCVRRLREHLELDYGAIEIVLRMSRRIRTLLAETRRLEIAADAARSRAHRGDWVEAEWDELT